MRRTGALLVSHRGPAPFPLLSLYVLSSFSPLPRPARFASFPGIHRANYGEGGETMPRKSRGGLFGGAGISTKKHRRGPTAYTFPRFQDTHTLLRRLITAGDFLPPQGPVMRGAKPQFSNTTHIGLYTWSTTSRDAVPARGEQKNKTSYHINQDSFASTAPKNIIIHDFQYPTIIITIVTAAATSQHGLHTVRREQVGLYIHTHSHIHIPRTFHGTGKNSPAHAKNRKDSPGPRLFSKDSASIFLSPNYFKSSYPFSPFTYFRVLSGRLQGE